MSLNKKSFTLIELMVSVGVLAVTLTLTSGILISIVRSYQKQAQIIKIERAGDLALNVIEEKVRKATSAGLVGGGNAIRIVTMVNGAPVSEEIGLSTTGTCKYIYVAPTFSSPTDANKVTDDSATSGVNISGGGAGGASFSNFVNGEYTYVNVTLNITTCTSPTLTRNFSTTIALRGSY